MTPPAFRIPFARISCDGNELAYLREVLESGWLTTASKAQAFEEHFRSEVGAQHALAVNSCTSALHLALEALGIQAGDQVFVPTLTFTATAEVIRYVQADPVVLDIEPGTGLLSPEALDRAAEQYPRARAVIVVHYAGQAARMFDTADRSGLVEVCRRRKLFLIEDAAHAFPARRDGRIVGAIGDITCFSFYANKTITTGEGGMITTENPDWAARMKVMRLHGIDRDVWARFTTNKPSWEYDVVAPGFKYNLSDIQAAIGLAQLERAEELRKRREILALRYLTRLSTIEHLELPAIEVAPEDHAWHLFPIVVRPAARYDRNTLIKALADRGIGTSVHYKPIHRLTYYRERYGLTAAAYPNAEHFWSGCLALPLFPSLREDEQEFVCESLHDLLG